MVRVVYILFMVYIGSVSAAMAQARHWTHPDYLQLQYAGSVGYISGGLGYDIFKERGRMSVHFGHVPASKGGSLNIFSGKLMYVPAVYPVSERIAINPFDFGVMISYHLGSDFRSRWPDHRYPENYYWWQTSFRFHLNAQPSVTVRIRDHTTFKTLTGYLDINSNELYLVSFFQNLRSIPAYKILKLGVGVRLHY
jgi:hypothetical protein